MTAAWAGVWVAIIVAVASLAAAVWKGGRREGKVDTVLEQLADIAKDHDARLRAGGL